MRVATLVLMRAAINSDAKPPTMRRNYGDGTV